VKRPLKYRDLFALEILENEFKTMSENLAATFPQWQQLSDKAKYDIIVVQTIALRLAHVCKFNVALVHKEGRVYCLVGTGRADLISEASRINYVLQLHNDPFTKKRKTLLRRKSLNNEHLIASLGPSANYLRQKIYHDVKKGKSSKEEKFPTQRKSVLLSPKDIQKIYNRSDTGKSIETTMAEQKNGPVNAKKNTKQSRRYSATSIFKNSTFSLDPCLDKDTTKQPYKRIVKGLKSMGHAPYQKTSSIATDSKDAIYYSPHSIFINKTHTRALYRTYEQEPRWNQANENTYRHVSLFRNVDRERLMLSLMNKHLNMHYLRRTILKDMLWLHKDRHIIEKKLWNSKTIMNTNDRRQAIHHIRNYFGESIALNHALTWELGRKLMGAGLVGFIVWLLLFTTSNQVLHRWLRVAYTIYILLWSKHFKSNWKKKTSEFNLLWGNKASQRPEPPRAEFKGIHVHDPITDELKLSQPNIWSQRIACKFTLRHRLLSSYTPVLTHQFLHTTFEMTRRFLFFFLCFI